MNVAMVLLLAALQVSAAGSSCDFTTREALPILRNLWRVSHTPARETERALFLTRDAAGTVGHVLWPATMQRRAASFRGALPAGTFAIAHTHPQGMPKPSQHDLAEAQRTGLPIYVITRTSITRVDPDRTTTEIANSTDWVSAVDRGADVCAMWA